MPRIRYIWMLSLLLIPVLPKIKTFSLSGVPILLDDFALAIAVLLGVIDIMGRASITGSSKIVLSQVGVLFLSLVLYKCIDLAILSLFYPWTDLTGIGNGVLVREGILVLGKTSAFVLVYIFFYNCLYNLESIHTVLKVYIATIVIVVGIALVQFFLLGHHALTSTFRNVHMLHKEVTGSWGLEDPWLDASAVGHEHLGAYMILSSSVLGGMLLCKWPPQKGRWLLQCLWAGCIFTLIFTSSRGAWIGGICALIVFMGFAFKSGKTAKLFYAILGISCGFLIFEWWSGVDVVNYIEQRSDNLFGILVGKVQDDSAKHRIGLYAYLWDVFLRDPILGWGPGGAGRIAEGQLIRELVEGGIIGGLLFIGLIFISGRIALKSYRLSRDPMVKGVSIGFLCGVVGIFGQSFFTELLILTKIGVPFWVLAAVVHRMYRIELQRQAAT